MTQAPLVSVIVPHYNHGRFLKQRLDSILAQTFQDFELIVLDDGSTDDGPRIIRDFAREHDELKVDLSAENSGSPFVQWQRGIKKAQGEFLWIAESDDYSTSEFLETVLEPLLSDNQVGVAYAGTQLVDEDGKIQDQGLWFDKDVELRQRWESDFISKGENECAQYLVRGNTIPNASAVVFRKAVFEKCGGVDTKYRYAGDWLLWVKMLQHSNLAYRATKCNFQRIYNTSTTQRSYNDPLHFLEYHKIRNFIAENIDIHEAMRKMITEQYQDDVLSQLLTQRRSLAGVFQILLAITSQRRQLPDFSFAKLLKGMTTRGYRRITSS